MDFMSKGPILLVEDDESIREALAEILQGEGFVVLSAENGYEALEILRRQTTAPRWILMDIAMPQMSGVECIEKLRENLKWAKIPVTLLSAGARAGDQAKLQGVAFIKKPVDIDVLLAAAEERCR
jgi:CheY-like chemotaxis protein